MNHEDDLINEAFEEFTTGSTPVIKIAGASVVRAEAKQRRRVRTTMLSVLAALVIITPVAAFAAMNRGNHGPPPVDPATSATASVAPRPTDGRFTRAQLVGATVELPSKGTGDCSGGRVQLKEKADENAGTIFIGQAVVVTNLDDDPELETAVEVLCVSGDPGVMWIVALDRDAAGNVISRGAILGTNIDQVKIIANLAARSDGGIYVSVCERCGSDASDQAWTGRHYFWNGVEFVHEKQNKPWVADLELTVKDVKHVIKDDNTRISVTVTITVTNKSNLPSGRFFAEFSNPPGPDQRTDLTPATWAKVFDGESPATRYSESLAPGQSRSITVTMTRYYSGVFLTDNWFTVGVVQVDDQGVTTREPNRANDIVSVKDFL